MTESYPTKTINGKSIRYESKMVNVNELEYYINNPRLMSVLEKYEGEIDQETIEKMMWDRNETHTLFQTIKRDGGLNEALLVYKGTVIEGNTRLCCIKKLCKENMEKWHMIPCDVILDEMTTLQIQRILIDKHIIGKNDWSAYDKSLLYYKLKHEEDLTFKEIADLVHEESESTIRNRVFAIEKYKQSKCEDIKKYSHFEQYVTNSEIKKIVSEDPKMEEIIIGQIINDNIPIAQDIRKIPKICRDKNAKKRFMQKSEDINEIISDLDAQMKFQNATVTKAARDLNDKIGKMSKEDIDYLKQNNQDKEDLRKLISNLIKLAKDVEIRLPNQMNK